jgi:hypothetical protein
VSLIGSFGIVLVAAVAFVFLRAAIASRSAKLALWQHAASARGLRYRAPNLLQAPAMEGLVNGSRVHVDTFQRSTGKSSVTYTRWRIEVPSLLLGDLRVDRESVGTSLRKALGGQDVQVGDLALDRAFRFRGADPAAVGATCRDPAVRHALLLAGELGASFELRDGQIVFSRRGLAGEDVDRPLEAGLQLAAALADAVEAPWLGLAAARGLPVFRQEGLLCLEGSSEGRAVRVEARVAGGRLGTRIRVGAAGTWPAGLRVEKGSGAGTGDPVLDGALSLWAADREAAVAVLRAADALRGVDLRGGLLEVLHGHPGSSVDEKGVELVLEGQPGAGLGDAFELAWRLAVGLDQAVEHVGRRAARPTPLRQ